MNGTDIALIVAIVVILLVLIGLAIAETGLNRISHVKAQAMAEDNPSKSTTALLELTDKPERFINPVLVSVTALQTAQAFLTTILAARLFGVWGVAGAYVLNVVVFFVLAESMPKTWAVLHTERAGLATARPTAWLTSFWPLRIVSRGLIGLTNVLLPGKGLQKGPFVSEQELLGIVEAAAEDEVIEHEERELIESIIEFGDTVAREIMVPRPDMVIIPHEATISEGLDLAIANGYSRLPVFGPDDADIVGLAYTKDLIRAEREGRGDLAVLDLARPVRFIPENKPVSRLMREMQAGKFHLAIVADEYGDIAGLVALEDCLEELVGEIVDEYDIEEHNIQRLPNGDYLVEGGTSIHDVNELLGCELPNDDWDTVGGLVFNMLEHVPEVGESIEVDRLRLSAEEVEGRRIRVVRVHEMAPLPVDDSAEAVPAAD
ncbi:CBS domain containing-hemolysin-like protein [Ilumatobacter fluminis]|uniref:CBS domain containing-hemolysin-like protein n=1 Tax=Ilumatobacter fluminis TaxID=467091 RepID=A0A4R7HYJ1_9ACTN|nr:hemolysin family protein [Ilumatobacter fluminis]TDT16171.1 CBS domain containing-hemolysin-like protein [Ilumatobacter fluminis]